MTFLGQVSGHCSIIFLLSMYATSLPHTSWHILWHTFQTITYSNPWHPRKPKRSHTLILPGSPRHDYVSGNGSPIFTLLFFILFIFSSFFTQKYFVHRRQPLPPSSQLLGNFCCKMFKMHNHVWVLLQCPLSKLQKQYHLTANTPWKRKSW